jgi:hypothetical protein
MAIRRKVHSFCEESDGGSSTICSTPGYSGKLSSNFSSIALQNEVNPLKRRIIEM